MGGDLTAADGLRVLGDIEVVLAFSALVVVCLVLVHRTSAGDPMRIARWWAWLRIRYVNNYRRADEDSGDDPGIYTSMPISIPVEAIPPADNADSADMGALNGGMGDITISRRPTDRMFVIFLATIRHPDTGKYRFSANEIYKIPTVGGDRNKVLAIIREIREGVPPPVFPLLDEKGKATREKYRLDEVEA